MTSPRLCFVAESGTDVRLVEGLAERFDLTILARKIQNGVEISQPPTRPISTVVGPHSRMAFALLVLKDLIKQRRRVDFVLVQNYGITALAANLASHFTGTPTWMLVCSSIEAYYRCRESHPMPGKPFRRLELWVLQILARMNAVLGQQYIVLSRHLREVVRQHGTRKPVHLIPLYGVDTQVFTPSLEPKKAIRGRLNLPTSGSLIFFSSRIAPEKDSETLLKAFQYLLAQGRDLWLLHRSGGYRDFTKEAVRFGVAERVIATDAVHPQKALPQSYQACDLCVQASREEGLGFSPLEALACGIPVIASATGGLRETIIDGETGWTYPVRDSKALIQCLESALDDPDEAVRRTARGRELVLARYDRQTVFEQLTKLVNGLLTQSSAPALVRSHGRYRAIDS